MEIIEKIVDFGKYCPKCEYYISEDYKDPCHECLNNSTNVHSQKPINFKEKEVKKETKKNIKE